MKTYNFKLLLAILLFLNTNFTNGQSIKQNSSSIGLHYWQRWDVKVFKSHNYGLTYSYLMKPKIEFCSDLGIHLIPQDKQKSEQKLTAYLALGGRYFPFSRNKLYIESQLLIHLKKLIIDENQLYYKTGIGYALPINNDIYLNLSYGLIINNKIQFYGSFDIYQKF